MTRRTGKIETVRRFICKADVPIDLRRATFVFQLSYAVIEKGQEFALELPDEVLGAVMLVVRTPSDMTVPHYIEMKEVKGPRRP